MLQGRKVKYVPGWDCHGLPIELKVLQNLKSSERQGLTPLALRWGGGTTRGQAGGTGRAGRQAGSGR